MGRVVERRSGVEPFDHPELGPVWLASDVVRTGLVVPDGWFIWRWVEGVGGWTVVRGWDDQKRAYV